VLARSELLLVGMATPSPIMSGMVASFTGGVRDRGEFFIWSKKFLS